MAKKRQIQIQTPDIDHCWSRIGVWGKQKPRCEKLAEVVHCRNCTVFSRAGRSVFERRPPAEYLSQWRKALAKPQRKKNQDRQGVMVFRLADEWYALPVKHLREISTLRPVHRIPHNTSNIVSGIVNISGEVRLCYSLASLLGVGEHHSKPDSSCPRMLVVELDGELFVFPVNEVSGLAHYTKPALTPAPATVVGERREFLRGMFRCGKRQVALLNPDALQLNLKGNPA